jgi:menaquinone-dependent protoporphyrinogen IX oxidase
MKTAVVYYTKTGHSRKIADAIANELHIQAEDIKNNPKLNAVDLLFIVGGIYAGKSDPGIISYVKSIESSTVKKVALVTSCSSNKTKQIEIREILERNKVEVIPEEYMCKGSFLFLSHGHPDQTDINSAVDYAKRLVK